ncbi:hypothetical protein ACH4D8_35750, partial [Streptomyces roseolus]
GEPWDAGGAPACAPPHDPFNRGAAPPLRIRFHLEPDAGGASTVLRFTNEFRGDRDLLLDCLAGWHDHFERLRDALDGRPTDWRQWTTERWSELRELYAQDTARWPKWVP